MMYSPISSVVARNATTVYLLVQIATFWPIWKWYIARMTDGSDEPWGVLALATAIAVTIGQRRQMTLSQNHLVVSTGLVLVYICIYPWSPTLVTALVVNASLACTLSAMLGNKGIHTGLLGLLVLSLPIIASLQFYLGYPIRWFSAHCSSLLLQALSIPALADGATLLWRGESVMVDAPCSGIKMLWSGLFLSFTCSSLNRLNALQTLTAYWLASGMIFVGNVCRVSVLFFSESGIVDTPPWFHKGVGIAIFLVVAGTVVWINNRLARRDGEIIRCPLPHTVSQY